MPVQDIGLAEASGKWDITRLIAGSSPSVVKSIVTDTHDLVFGVHQSFDPPEAMCPTPRKTLPFWIRRSRVFTADILQGNYSRVGLKVKEEKGQVASVAESIGF